MNQQRPPWQSDQANYQYAVPRNPPAKSVGNVQLYNPNQYTPNQQIPSNGAYMPQQPPPLAMTPGQAASGWDQNVNKYANYQQNHSVHGQHHQIVPPTQPSPMFNMPDYSLNNQVPNFPPDLATNNNQVDPTGNSSDGWGWEDAGDWGPPLQLGNENPQQQGQLEALYQQQQHQQPQSLPPVQVDANHFQPPPPTTTGLENSLNAMSLVEQPPPPQYSSQADATVPWSRAPAGWGTTDELIHNHGYTQELGERNTLADGASFTDPSQLPPPPQSSAMRPTHQLSGDSGSLYQSTGESSLRSSHPPPSTLALGEIKPLIISASPQPSASWTPTTEPISEAAAASDGMVVQAAEVFNGAPYNGCVETLEPTPSTNAEVADTLPPIGARLPASGSRSQSGTPSMERESERPDAEGGYENDQPTPLYLAQASGASMTFGAINSDRKGAQESPATSRPASRQAGSTPSTETPNSNQSPSYMVSGGGSDSFVRPKPVSSAVGGATGTGGGPGFYASPNTTSTPITSPPQSASPFHVARGSQEAVGSEYGPPVSRSDNAMLPPSSQRMIPGSGSQGPSSMSVVPPTSTSQQQPQQQSIPQAQQQQQQQRPPGSVTPVSEQRIVTGYAKNDPVPPPSLLTATPQPAAAQVTVGPSSMGIPPSAEAETRSSLNRSPPSHRSETIGSENPRANTTTGTPATMASGGGGPSGGGVNSADRSDERGSTVEQGSRDRDHHIKPHDSRSRMDRDRDRDRDHDRDYDRDGRSRYADDDEDERFSTSYRERDRRDDRRNYPDDRDRDRDHPRTEHRVDRGDRRYAEERDRERGYGRDSRDPYDDDRRSAYAPSDRDRNRDGRRRDPRRSDYYGLDSGDTYERSGGRRSSLYEGESGHDHRDPTGDFNRSAYGFNTSRDARRRDTDRSRPDDRYYQPGPRDRASGEGPDRANSERDYRHGVRHRDPREAYYQDPRYYVAGYPAYDPYRADSGYASSAATAAYMQYYNQRMDWAMKYNLKIFHEMRLENPAAYTAWYQAKYAQRYTPTVVTGTGTIGSMANSEADRASVHSGRSSVNEDHLSMLPNHSAVSRQIRGSTTGLDQSQYDEYSVYHEENHNAAMTSVLPTIQDLTPPKFSGPHVIGCFSCNGLLLRVQPNRPMEGVPAMIEFHDLGIILGDLPSAKELKFFPGPLVVNQTHKQQVTVFCLQKIRRTLDDLPSNHPAVVDHQSYVLLWELLLLLLRQNGTIVGTDIAELLLKDHEILREPIVQQQVAEPAESASEAGSVVVAADRTLVSRQTEASVTKKFRELLLFGNKKEALEWAMAQGLWGHALFLASKMDQRTYSSVMIRFANGLALTDPLQTLYQLMSGRQPTAVTSCGDDKWGDWRPHLSMILSNSSARSANGSADLDKKSIVTMGDTLLARGFLLAAHFCYLVAQVEFGNYSNKSSKLMLLGSSGSLPFEAFATSEAIQCTEIYEYARQLAAPNFVIPSFQSYKFLYATRLAEHGRSAEALQYCEAVANVLTRSPSSFSPGLIEQVYRFGSKLKYNDPQYVTETDGSTMDDPTWLKDLEKLAATSSQYELSPGEVETAAPIPTFSITGSQEQTHTADTISSLSPGDYPSYQQPMIPGVQYGDSQQQQQQQQQQQYYSQPQQQQQSQFYDPLAGQQQQQQQANFTEDSRPEVVAESLDVSQYGNSVHQDYGQPYSGNFDWQQQQQTQQPWNYGGPSQQEYWKPSNNNLSSISANEDIGSYSAADSSYFNQSSSTAAGGTGTTTTAASSSGAKQDDKSNKENSKSAATAAARAQAASGGSSWIGGFFNKFKPKTQMKLPDDKNPTIVWDPVKNQWVDTTKDGESEAAALAPPPKDPNFSFQSLPSMPNTPAFALSPGPQSLAPSFNDANMSASSYISTSVNTNNNNSRGGGATAGRGRLARGGRAYVKPSNMQFVSSPNVSVQDPFPAPGTTSSNMTASTPQFFVPSPANMDPSAPSDFVTSPAPQSGDFETSGGNGGEQQFMYSANLAPPVSDGNAARRGNLTVRGRYPR